MSQTKDLAPQTVDKRSMYIDMLRTAQFGDITKMFLVILQEYKSLPADFNRNILQQTIDQLSRFQREVKRCVPPPEEQIYLNGKSPKRDKLVDISTVIDMMVRIGKEEQKDTHEEFLGLLVDCLDSVFYSQINRHMMQRFGKYKALFKLIASEIKADVNGEPGQLLYTNKGELCMRMASPISKSQIKTDEPTNPWK